MWKKWKIFCCKLCWCCYRKSIPPSVAKNVVLLLKALWKQDDFCWKHCERKLTFVENSPKAGWLLLKAPWKPFKKLVNHDDTKVLRRNRVCWGSFLSKKTLPPQWALLPRSTLSLYETESLPLKNPNQSWFTCSFLEKRWFWIFMR